MRNKTPLVEVSFYHLQTTPLEKSLPRLLEKVLQAGKRAVVLTSSEERLAALDTVMWTYAAQSFLPHGSKRDGLAEHQPIWLTTTQENPNHATVVVATDGIEINDFDGFERCLDLFDGNDLEATSQARKRWKQYQQAGHTLAYWKQDDSGSWKKQD